MAAESDEAGPPVTSRGARSRRRRWVTFAVVLVLAAGVTAYFVLRDRVECGSVEEYRVAVAPDLAPVIEEVAGRVRCTRYEIVAQEPGEVAAQLGTSDVPDLWIPAGGWWAPWAGRTATGPVRTISLPVATTPVVLAGAPDAVDRAADWQTALQGPDLVFGNPLRTGAAAGAIRAVLAEAEGDAVAMSTVRPVLAPLADRESIRNEEPPTGTNLLAEVVAAGGVAVTTEQQVDTYRRTHERDLETAVPLTGTLLIDYPLVVTARDGRHDPAGAAGASLIDILHTPDGLAALARHGFRDGGGRPLPDGRGVGPVPILELPDESVGEEAMSVWALMALPVRTIFAVDVSASMNRTLGEETRIELVRRAAVAANDILPGSVSAGLWLFGGDVGGTAPGGTPQDGDAQAGGHVVAAPIRRFDTIVEGRTHRDVMTSLVESMQGTGEEETALYDTILAAFRHVQETYDPRASNSVVVVTDGTDEGSSITREELVATLEAENDPARPVRVVTIGLGDDVDSASLEEISTATGGTSYLTSDPLDITDLVVTALAERTGG
ncbi:substrate-binding and VWA domain-containing protein [Rhodococcus sp. Z13]|uniref:Substrate-binding and VWA domain-containing protein n=1 Tax=Rhodococcus sacchari TaxID=2962047 RepID=A0ACD4DJ37_9NOCA|nr:substrate-binding and VWA domain-containing protein [Rhodococcus sp. Z13]UYP20048.1 substrate-binding and VWA domain-containing protein [Rhodococcus sp. Z13]